MSENLIHSCCLSENELDEIVEFILQELNFPQIILLEADLGSGKTTLIRKIIQEFDNNIQVKSPTFNIVNEYFLNNKRILHFDLYRIQKIEELEEIGFSEYLETGDLIFIEWPQIATDYFKNYLNIKIFVKDNRREYLVFKN